MERPQLQPNTLLTTKFYQPSPAPRRVERARLSQRLTEGLAAGSQLTLVSAPAGFGKTTCVSEWLESLDFPVAWLSLDEADNDPGRFLTYFIAALQRVDENIGRAIESVLSGGQVPPLEAVTTTLVNDILAWAGRFPASQGPSRFGPKLLLVLDDFQVIQDRANLAVLERLIANQPEGLHLVLITREDPSLPLARLRANNQMTEIRARDLRFSSQETGRFLNGLMGLSLTEGDLEALEDRTEGWVVGLQLAGLSMRGRADPSTFIAGLSGSNRYILSYLMEEVLGRQSEEIQQFLQQTSVLNRLTGDLCDAVTGQTGSSLLLERLFHANLFLISLDEDGQWYRYHHLFADLLRSQRSRFQKDQTVELHQRASRWYEGAGMAGEAIEHALAAADYPHALQLLERNVMQMVMQGYARTVEGWMQAIPPERRSQSPKTSLAFAWMHLIRGNYGQVAQHLQQAEAMLSAPAAEGDPGGEETKTLWAEIFALQSNMAHVAGKAAEGRRLANLALESTPADNFYIHSLAYVGLGGAYRQAGDFPSSVAAYQKAIQASRTAGNTVSEILAVTALTLMAIEHGQLHFAAETGAQAIEGLERAGVSPPPIAGPVYGTLGILYYEWNELEKARSLISRSLELSRLSGHTAGLIYDQTLLARLAWAEGDLEAGSQAIREAARLMQYGAPAWLKPEVAAQQVRIELAGKNPAAAEATLNAFGLSSQEGAGLPGRFHPAEPIFLAHLRLLLFQAQETRRAEDLQSGIELAGALLAEAAADRRMAIELQALLLRGLMQAARGDREAGLVDLDQALELAEPEGFLRTFVDEGPALAALLRAGLERGIRPGYVTKLLAAFPGNEPAATVAEPTRPAAERPAGIPAVQLSERELEVLRLMAAGLKYEEIAEQLVITLNTVRFHVKMIYSKLNANNRTRAIETARVLELI